MSLMSFFLNILRLESTRKMIKLKLKYTADDLKVIINGSNNGTVNIIAAASQLHILFLFFTYLSSDAGILVSSSGCGM